MTAYRSFASVVSYYFRDELARRDREQREYGGRPLEDYTLEDYRPIYSRAVGQAIAWRRSLRPWRAA